MFLRFRHQAGISILGRHRCASVWAAWPILQAPDTVSTDPVNSSDTSPVLRGVRISGTRRDRSSSRPQETHPTGPCRNVLGGLNGVAANAKAVPSSCLRRLRCFLRFRHQAGISILASRSAPLYIKRPSVWAGCVAHSSGSRHRPDPVTFVGHLSRVAQNLGHAPRSQSSPPGPPAYPRDQRPFPCVRRPSIWCTHLVSRVAGRSPRGCVPDA